jgi:dihydrofolate synthase/folylpolyglutamate synthase
MMNYSETLRYLYGQYLDFQQHGRKAYKPGLDGARQLDALFGHPHRRYATIHVGGTNGKGSTAHLLAAVLQRAGYRTGLYTSPHLTDFRERIRVNGCKIPEADVVAFVAEHRAAVEPLRPSFFELATMMAFCHFAQQAVDVAVVEVGLGGRLDTTNVIAPLLSIITNIGLDHTDLLGGTLAQIAAEKAGIIKPGTPVVVGERQPEVAHIFAARAAACGAPLTFADQQEHNLQRYPLDLRGGYQRQNLRTVLAALEVLRRRSPLAFTAQHVAEGLRTAAAATGLRGRWQQLGAAPKVVCDVAHNAHGLREAMAQLERERQGQLHIVFGMVADKDIDSALATLPADARCYFTQASTPRALPAEQLAAKGRGRGLQGEAFTTVAQALAAARGHAAAGDFIYVGGSTFVVADALAEAEGAGQ